MSFGKYSFGKVSFGGALVEEVEGVTITPSPASAIGQVVAPTVIKGSVSIIPSPVSSIVGVVQPTVIKGSVSITPEYVKAIAQVVAPIVAEGITPPSAPIILEASNITENSARTNAQVDNDGGQSCEGRFRHRKVGYSEEQTASNTLSGLYAGGAIRGGQRRTISNQTVSNLSFYLRKGGSPTGDITFTIRKVSDDSIIVSKVWGDASALAITGDWKEVTFDSPVTINEEVRLLVEFNGGNSSNAVHYSYQNTDVKANEVRTRYVTSYADFSASDVAYKYTHQYAWVTTEWANGLQTNDLFYADISDLELGIEYEFQAQLRNSAGESEWSESKTFTTTPIIVPSPVSAIASVVAPKVKQGNIFFIPTPVSAIAKAVNPTVLLPAITPAPISAIAGVVNPVVVLGSISITPDYIEAIGQVVAPIVSAGEEVMYVTPDPVDAIGDTVNPTVILGSVIVIPDALSAIGQVVAPKVKQSSMIFSPAFIKALGKGVNPTVIRGSLILAPESIKAIARGQNPEVILGEMTFTPEFVKALAGVINPRVLQTWIGRKLRLVIITTQNRKVNVVTSQYRKVDVATTQKRKVRVLTGE